LVSRPCDSRPFFPPPSLSFYTTSVVFVVFFLELSRPGNRRHRIWNVAITLCYSFFPCHPFSKAPRHDQASSCPQRCARLEPVRFSLFFLFFCKGGSPFFPSLRPQNLTSKLPFYCSVCQGCFLFRPPPLDGVKDSYLPRDSPTSATLSLGPVLNRIPPFFLSYLQEPFFPFCIGVTPHFYRSQLPARPLFQRVLDGGALLTPSTRFLPLDFFGRFNVPQLSKKRCNYRLIVPDDRPTPPSGLICDVSPHPTVWPRPRYSTPIFFFHFSD